MNLRPGLTTPARFLGRVRNVATSLKEKQYLLYHELYHTLLNSRIAFYSFCKTGANNSTEARCILYTQGACKLPGWQEYVTKFAFPLNEKTKQVILKIEELTGNLGYSLTELLSYINDWDTLHTAYVRGENPTYNWTAGRNFPQGIDIYVEDALVELAGEPTVKHLLLTI
jgi:hypothetical protein